MGEPRLRHYHTVQEPVPGVSALAAANETRLGGSNARNSGFYILQAANLRELCQALPDRIDSGRPAGLWAKFAFFVGFVGRAPGLVCSLSSERATKIHPVRAP